MDAPFISFDSSTFVPYLNMKTTPRPPLLSPEGVMEDITGQIDTVLKLIDPNNLSYESNQFLKIAARVPGDLLVKLYLQAGCIPTAFAKLLDTLVGNFGEEHSLWEEYLVNAEV